jgi:hypothetical protein
MVNSCANYKEYELFYSLSPPRQGVARDKRGLRMKICLKNIFQKAANLKWFIFEE